MQDVPVDVGEIQHEGRPVPLGEFPVRPLYEQVARADFHHGVVLAHIALAEGVDALRAAAGDAVHAGAAPSLGKEGGFLFGIQRDDLGPGLIGQCDLASRNEGGEGAVEGIEGRVDGNPPVQAAEGRNDDFRPDDVERAVKDVETRRADGLSVLHEDLGALDIFQHVDALRTDKPCESALDVFAVVDVRPPASGLSESGGAVEGAVRVVQEFDAEALQYLDHLGHGLDPLPDLAGGIAAGRRTVEVDDGFRRVAGGVRIQHRHEMVVAAAEGAAAFQFALIGQKHAEAVAAGGKGRAAPGGSRPEDQDVRFVHDA